MKHRSSACHGFSGPFHEGRLLRTCEEPSALLIRGSVNLSSHISEDFRDILNFIQNGRRANFLNKGMGVCPEACDDIRILKQIILGFREELSEKGRFPCSSGPVRISPGKCFEAKRSSGSICLGMYFILSILNRYFK